MSKVLGSSKSSGALGLGQFKAQSAPISEEGFKQKLSGKGTQEALRQRQLSQTQRLEETATGQRPSLAEAQLKSAADRSLAQQIGAAQARRGGNVAAREQALARSAGTARRQLSQDASSARLAEQQQAEAALTNQLAQTRDTDIGLASGDRASLQNLEQLKVNQNIGLQGLNLSGFQSAAQQRSGFVKNVAQGLAKRSDKNAKTGIKKEGAFTKFAQGFSEGNDAPAPTDDGAGKSASASSRASIGNIKAASDENSKTAVAKIDPVKAQSAPTPPAPPAEEKESGGGGPGIASLMGKGGGAAAGAGAGGAASIASLAPLLAMSDKKNKKEVDMTPKGFLDKLQAYSYEYKDAYKNDPQAGKGRFLSVMAQDLEKAGDVGKSAVDNTPTGKVVDYGKLAGAMLASQADLNERLKSVEGSKQKSPKKSASQSSYGSVIQARKKLNTMKAKKDIKSKK